METPAPTKAKEGAAIEKNIVGEDSKKDPMKADKATPADAPGNIVGRKSPRERPTNEPVTTRM
jgi:hypothetical protein